MSLYKLFKTSEKHETEGIWLDYGEGMRIRIARAGGSNKAFLKASEKLQRKYRRQSQLDLLSEEMSRRIFKEIYAETIVLAWENVKDESGNPMECNRQNIIKLFTDLHDLFMDVRAQAENLALWREELDEADAKNSPRS